MTFWLFSEGDSDWKKCSLEIFLIKNRQVFIIIKTRKENLWRMEFPDSWKQRLPASLLSVCWRSCLHLRISWPRTGWGNPRSRFTSILIPPPILLPSSSPACTTWSVSSKRYWRQISWMRRKQESFLRKTDIGRKFIKANSHLASSGWHHFRRRIQKKRIVYRSAFFDLSLRVLNDHQHQQFQSVSSSCIFFNSSGDISGSLQGLRLKKKWNTW